MSVVFEEPNMGLLNVIGKRGGVCRVCTEFIDTAETGRNECLKSDSGAAERAKEKLRLGATVPVEFYICNGKFRNFVIPVSIAGEALGNVYAGQFLVKPLQYEDPEFEENIQKMNELGMARGRVLSYASLPTEDDFPLIIRDNGIPKEREAEFVEAYREMLKKALPLQYVIDAVYLLHEVAQTISSLGNVYYYNNIFSRLMHILPTELKLADVDLINKINNFLLGLEIHPPLSYSEEIAHANELIHKVLSRAVDYFRDYAESLLTVYREVAESSETLGKAESLIVVGAAKLEAQKLHQIVGTPLRDRAVSERGRKIYSDQGNKLLDNSESLLKKVEEILSTEEAPKLSRDMILEISKIVNDMKKIQKELLDQKIGKKISFSTIDAIETLLEYIDDKQTGLKAIVRFLCTKRVLERIPEKWRKFRERLGLRYDIIYLNWGGISPTFDETVASRQLWSLGIDRFGPVSDFSEQLLESSGKENVLQKTRQSISKIINCRADEIILTPNTTRGIALALSSILFPPKEGEVKERILLSNLEHDTVRNCVNRIKKKFNVLDDHIEISDKTAKIISDQIIEKSHDGKTRVVILSHVTFNTGQVLDVTEIIGNVRKKLGPEAPCFIIDGAQAVGQIPVDMHKIGCEFYAADGYKWLNGPRGAGFLFVKKEYLDEHSDEFELYEKYVVSPKYAPKDPQSGHFYEPATLNVEPYIGLSKTLDLYLDEKDADSRFSSTMSLAKNFRKMAKDELKDFDIEIMNHQSSPGIVVIRFKDENEHSLYESLRKSLDERFNIKCRAVDRLFPALRFCINYLNSDEEIKLAILATKKLLEETPSFAKKKKVKVEKKTRLEKRRDDSKHNIEELYRGAANALTVKERKTKERFYWFRFKGKRILKEKSSQLRTKKVEILKQVEEAQTVKNLEFLESKAEDEFKKILEGNG